MRRDRLLGIEIHRFRGVADKLLLDLDADAVIVTGANGTGKTTLADAIAWCLTGDLPALKRRQTGEPLKDDYVVSAYRRRENAVVALEMELAGRRVRLQRTGDASGSDIEIEGSSATAGPLLEAVRQDQGLVERWLAGTALLRQGIVEQFLTAKSDERHRELRALLGLTVLDDFEEAVTSAHTALQRRAIAAAAATADTRRRIEEREQRLAVLREASAADSRPVGAARLEQIFAAVDGVDATVPALVTPEIVEALGREVGTILTAAERVVSTISMSGKDREDAAEAAWAARARLDEAHAALEQASSAAPWQQLASTALQLLKDPSCPLCQQPIDVESLRMRLEGLVERSAGAAKDLDAAKQRLARAGSEVARTTAMLEQAERAQEAQAAAQRESRRLLGEVGSVRVEPEVTLESAARLVEALTQLRANLRQLWLDIRSPAGRAEVDRLDAEVGDLRSALTQAESTEAAAAKQATDAKALKEATTSSCLKITSAAMEELTPALRVVHDRLAPHPTFRELDLVHKFAHRKGRTSARVEDPFRSVAANPAIVFSDGQLNALAVAIFSAVALSVPHAPIPFLMLDDPLQALDAPNVLALADLCRELRDRRQLIITTHDRRFAAVLERKLAPREEGSRTRVLRFTGWRPEGPAVEAEMLPLDIPPPVLHAA